MSEDMAFQRSKPGNCEAISRLADQHEHDRNNVSDQGEGSMVSSVNLEKHRGCLSLGLGRFELVHCHDKSLVLS